MQTKVITEQTSILISLWTPLHVIFRHLNSKTFWEDFIGIIRHHWSFTFHEMLTWGTQDHGPILLACQREAAGSSRKVVTVVFTVMTVRASNWTLIMLLVSLSSMHVWHICFLSHQAQQNYSFQAVELSVLSNHGNPDYTCIYRFRVHGTAVTNVQI